MLCFSINNVKAQSFTIDYDGYSLMYHVLPNNPNNVAVSCPEEPEEDEIELIIPSTVISDQGKVFTVTTISECGFEDKPQFISVTFPNTITTIEPEAFLDCTGISGELILDGIIQKIGDNAFEGCSGITSLTISSTKLKKIGNECFSDCKNLENVNFKSPITTILYRSFYNCAIKKLQLPNSLTTISDKAFERNASLTEVIFNNKISSIGERVFYRCNNLTVIRCYSTNVPELASNESLGALYNSNPSFNINPNLTIYVPASSLDEYESAEYWEDYETYDEKDRIVGMPTFVRDGSLNDGNNWYPIGVPSGDDVVVFINANGTIAGGEDPFHVNSFYMGDNGSITIRETPAGIGQIIHHADSDEVSIIKHIEPYIIKEDGYLESGWYTISTPINDLVLSDNNFLKDGYELFRYNESNYEWENHKNPNNDFTTLDAGRGYIYANRDQQIITITGKLNVDKETKCYITAFGEYLRGFNLIGNPYMHDIHKGEGCAIFHKYLSTGFYTLSNDGWWAPCPDGTAAIAPLQSILIQTDFDVDLTIEKNTNKPYKPRSLNNGLVTINVSNEKYKDAAYVTFNEGLGLQKISHRNNAIPMVYIPIDNIDYAIAIMDDKAEEIPINFEAMTMGEYTINVSSTECNYNGITLIDRLTGTETNMLVEDYKFMATTNDNPERFIIKVSINESTEADIFTQDDNIIINNIKGNGTIQIYDVTGRAIIKQNTSGSNCQISSYAMANGIYIVNVADDNGTTTKKIMINNK